MGRSLVYAFDETGGLCIASAPPSDRIGVAAGWRELPCGVVSIDLSSPMRPCVDHLEWRGHRPPFGSPLWWSNSAVAPGGLVQKFREVLLQAVARRVLPIPDPPAQ